MKNIIIWGCSRSGKTSISKRIKDIYNLNLVEIDCIKEAYKVTNTHMNLSNCDDFVLGEKLNEYLAAYINKIVSISNVHGEYYIFEGTAICLPRLMESIDLNKFIIFCLGYPNITWEQKYQELTLYENKFDWTIKLGEEDKKCFCKKNIETSKTIKSIAQQLDVHFFDTSYNREKVFCEIISYIKEQTGGR